MRVCMRLRNVSVSPIAARLVGAATNLTHSFSLLSNQEEANMTFRVTHEHTDEDGRTHIVASAAVGGQIIDAYALDPDRDVAEHTAIQSLLDQCAIARAGEEGNGTPY